MASPVIIGPRVYFGSDDGWLYALDRTRRELLWKLSLGALHPCYPGVRQWTLVHPDQRWMAPRYRMITVDERTRAIVMSGALAD